MLPLCFWEKIRYFYDSRDNYLDVYSYDPKSICYALFFLLAIIDFQYVNPLSLKHCVAINTMSPFIYIQHINKWIAKNYDTQPDKNEK